MTGDGPDGRRSILCLFIFWLPSSEERFVCGRLGPERFALRTIYIYLVCDSELDRILLYVIRKNNKKLTTKLAIV